MSTTTVTLTCPECEHDWDLHSEFAGVCAAPRCWCGNRRPRVTVADRLALLRAEKGDTLLTSHVDDRRNVVVGHVVTQATPDESDFDPWVGVVVDRWHTDDGEPGVTAVKFAKRGGDVTVLPRRWKVDELRQEHLPNPDPYTCAYTARMLHKVIGQRIKRNGMAEPLNDFERTLACWADALDRACQ